MKTSEFLKAALMICWAVPTCALANTNIFDCHANGSIMSLPAQETLMISPESLNFGSVFKGVRSWGRLADGRYYYTAFYSGVSDHAKTATIKVDADLLFGKEGKMEVDVQEDNQIYTCTLTGSQG